MKKYIAPVAKNILLRSELSMLISGSDTYPDVDGDGNPVVFSGRRGGASSVIWGFDDGVVIEDE